MGLLKNISTDIGVDATYWNVGNFYLDKQKEVVIFRMFGYANKDLYLQGKKNITFETLEFPLDMEDLFIKPFKELNISYEIQENEKVTVISLQNIIDLQAELKIDLPALIEQILNYCYIVAKGSELFIDAFDD